MTDSQILLNNACHPAREADTPRSVSLSACAGSGCLPIFPFTAGYGERFLDCFPLPRLAAGVCKSVFRFRDLRQAFAKVFSAFATCGRRLQKCFPFPQIAEGIYKSVFHLRKLRKALAEMFSVCANCGRRFPDSLSPPQLAAGEKSFFCRNLRRPFHFFPVFIPLCEKGSPYRRPFSQSTGAGHSFTQLPYFLK